MIDSLPWVILFLPLASFLAIGLTAKTNREASARISVGAVALSFLSALVYISARGWAPMNAVSSFEWVHVGSLRIEMGVLMDPLSLLMLLVVTGVGTVIHIFSIAYMSEDRGLPRYFAYLSLFMFSMLGIVLSSNFIQMFVFWELVGVSSYLLIGFWFEKPSAADACKKAFLTNRLGDFGFLLGILMVWGLVGSLGFSEIQSLLSKDPNLLGGAAGVAGLLIFCGTMGKSAQFPLHGWLPDAMEGPTPVSALIHAATMVAAGVYMLCRVFFVLDLDSSFALEVIAWIGGITAFLAALMAMQQDDIKRILAYSTLSQLGYMVLAVGVHGPTEAMYHLTTHAFFKAMLFLGAGSVIFACHHEQDIWKMGGLREKMPVTFWTFLLGTLALCGVPPLSGFYSKDAILNVAMHHSPILFILGWLTAIMTAFYMTRLVFVAFLGKPRSHAAEEAGEAPNIMTGPLVVLAVPTVLAGICGLDVLLARQLGADHLAHAHSIFDRVLAPINHDPLAAMLGLLAVMIGVSAGGFAYHKAVEDPFRRRFALFSRILAHRFYLDEIFSEAIQKTHDSVAVACDALDRWVLQGFVIKGATGLVDLISRVSRVMQSGNLQTYSALIILSLAMLLYFIVGI